MQNTKEDHAETRQGRRSRVEGCDDRVRWGFKDTSFIVKSSSVNEVWLGEDPADISTKGLSPASGLPSPPEMQIPDGRASFAQVVGTVVTIFRAEDNLYFFYKWGALSRLGLVNSRGGQCKPPSSRGPTCEAKYLLSRCPAKVGKPETLPSWVQMYGRKLNSISPQVLRGSILSPASPFCSHFQFCGQPVFMLFKMKLEPKGKGQR